MPLFLRTTSSTVLGSVNVKNAADLTINPATEETLTLVDDDLLQIDGHLTSGIAISSLPNEGQQNMANSISVTIASDQSTLIFSGTTQDLATDDISVFNVAASLSSVTLFNSNSTRRMAMVYNESTGNLYVKLGSTASVTSYTYKIPPGGGYEIPTPAYILPMDGIWDIANGNARCTEWVVIPP